MGKLPFKRTCVTCGSVFLQVNHPRRVQRFCQRKCYRQTSAAKERIRAYQLGRPKSHRGKPRPWKAGERCHFWRGGVSKTNRTERQNFSRTLEYVTFRREVLARDNYTCVLCGDHSYKGRGGHCYLVVDHVLPYALYPELRLDKTNARTLCDDCHKNTDTYGVRTLRVLQTRSASG